MLKGGIIRFKANINKGKDLRRRGLEMNKRKKDGFTMVHDLRALK